MALAFSVNKFNLNDRIIGAGVNVDNVSLIDRVVGVRLCVLALDIKS